MTRVQTFAVIALFLAGCAGPQRAPFPSDAPGKMLWAWERPEDLRFIDPSTTGVAFLAQTLSLEANNIRFSPRRQPLDVPDGAYLVAVTRIDREKRTSERPAYSEEQLKKLAGLIVASLDLPNVRGIQIDFDAAVSERDFYRRLVDELRRNAVFSEKGDDNGRKKALTMTALASWCIGDRWLSEMAVDEAVPMAFVMGADSERVRGYLRNGNDWTEPICTESYGISLDEQRPEGLKPGRRIYYFKNSPWSKSDLENL